MANIIQIKRGAEADLPILSVGEFGFTTDTNKLFVGDGVLNHLVNAVPKHRDVLTYNGLSSYNTGGTLTGRGSSLEMETGSLIGDLAYLYPKRIHNNVMNNVNKFKMSFGIYETYAGIGGDYNFKTIRIYNLNAGNVATSEIVDTDQHIGFLIEGNDIYASNADGTTQKKTDSGVNLPTGPALTFFNLEFSPGTDCKFYINGSLVATHTSNLPGGNYFSPEIQVVTLELNKKLMWVSPLYFEMEN